MLEPSLSCLQIPVVMKLSHNNSIDLPPLVWAFAMGSCLGGEAQTQTLPQHHAGSCTTLAADTETLNKYYFSAISYLARSCRPVACEHRRISEKYGNPCVFAASRQHYYHRNIKQKILQKRDLLKFVLELLDSFFMFISRKRYLKLVAFILWSNVT